MESERKELFIQSHDKTIREILNTGSYHYEVPDFQRPYSWNTAGSQRKQVVDLWDDLWEIIYEGRRDFHFMGAMIFAKKPGDTKTRIIIDGQQRLVTLTIILASLRDVIFEILTSPRYRNKIDEPTRKYLEKLARTSIHERAIAGFDEITGEYISLIDPHPDDREFFWKMIVRYEDSEGNFILFKNKKEEFQSLKKAGKLYESHIRIWNAYEYSYRQIKKLIQKDGKIKNGPELRRTLHNFFTILMDSLQVIATQAKNEEDAHIIFETLNDRGIELTVTDLVRNYLFSKASKNGLHEYVKQQWEVIKTNVVVKGKNMDTFFRYYHIIFVGKGRKKGLYKHIKLLLEDKIQKYGLKETLNELVWYSRVYGLLTNPPEKAWGKSSVDLEIHKLLIEHKLFGVQQDLPLLMVAYKLYENGQKDEFKKILNFTNSVIVRYLKLLENSPNILERIYGRLAYELNETIQSGKYSTFEMFIKEQVSRNTKDNLMNLLQEIQDDDKIKTLLSTSPMTPTKAKELLIALTNREKGIIADPNEVSLEHILPQSPGRGWEHITLTTEELEKYVNNIGNLTLLASEDNKHVSNAPYSKKLEYYRKSKYPLTQEIPIEYPKEWNIETIKQRAQKILERILNTWRIDIRVE
ncbi:DUF262 domain-containing protein [Thermococcus sp. GR4]|uniref:DUF262 domain-containing protein n=1 Tax=Thermococcus sp. GR4 TaxID=1638254 RepID=UPI0014311D20|nr:DUF262 domain-containing protein [Thermococcus sp. GR4]NJE79542.1 DUF262 domain-containing protein [Thermococcus sp. GR4]